MINVLYHSNCMDGLASAAISKEVLGDNGHRIPVQYGEPFPYDKLIRDKEDNIRLLIVDFSYPLEVMERLERTPTIIIDGVLDHHISVDDKLKEKPYFVFDNNKSGCRLTWEWFHPHQPSPWWVDYIEDRDLWNWKLPNSKYINTALSTIRKNNISDFMDTIRLGSQELFTIQGIGIDRFKRLQIESVLEHKHIICVEKFTFLAVNNTISTLTSEIGNELAKENGIGAVYWFNPKIRKYVVSLRSIGDKDVSVIAKNFGGGGHKNAAGFSTNNLSVLTYD